MEKVFDLHVHYLFEIPLEETIEIFKEEFTRTSTAKQCFASLPHHAGESGVDHDVTQNVKGLYLKKAFSPNGYAFAGLEHPNEHNDEEQIAQDFLNQAKKYLSVGFDGIKMLEGYPSLIKGWNLPIDSKIYHPFYAFMEENGYPILIHVANPKENWDIHKASPEAIKAGRVYDSSYPTKEEIMTQVFRVMEKFPALKLILAHFGFMSYDKTEAERYMAYPNTCLDITPGGEQFINMQKNWDDWLPFWEKYQDRIFYGTDFYAFPKDENWEVAFMRRPKFLRQFLETNSEHEYLGEKFFGVDLEKKLLDKIYRENFIKLLGDPKKICNQFFIDEANRILAMEEKVSKYADMDMRYILSEIK